MEMANIIYIIDGGRGYYKMGAWTGTEFDLYKKNEAVPNYDLLLFCWADDANKIAERVLQKFENRRVKNPRATQPSEWIKCDYADLRDAVLSEIVGSKRDSTEVCDNKKEECPKNNAPILNELQTCLWKIRIDGLLGITQCQRMLITYNHRFDYDTLRGLVINRYRTISNNFDPKILTIAHDAEYTYVYVNSGIPLTISDKYIFDIDGIHPRLRKVTDREDEIRVLKTLGKISVKI